MTPAPGRRRRVYLRVDRQGLEVLAAGDALPTAGQRAYAVTDLVRAAFPGQDEEELEYEAMCVAAESVPDGASGTAGPARVVVVATDLPAAQVRDLMSPAGAAGPVAAQDAYAVELAGPLRRAEVVSVHAQDDARDPDAELLWYDVSELSALVEPPT